MSTSAAIHLPAPVHTSAPIHAPAPIQVPAPILDTLVRTEAPEGIYLEMRPAGVTARLYAFLIDLAIRGAIVIAASMVLTWAGGMGFGVFFIVLFVVEWFYPVLFELTLAGATPGKRML
ncbi:MAG TPA: RDD family protein, partial [Burkholderiaceae bacterium]|nr:RDD family protein [Burkholderiaceae bacterium]